MREFCSSINHDFSTPTILDEYAARRRGRALEVTERPKLPPTTAQPEVEAVYRFNYTNTDQERPSARKHHHEVRQKS